VKRALVIAFLFSAFNNWAVEISGKQAAIAASNWIKRNPSPLDSRVGKTVVETKTYNDDSNNPLFHVVRFEEGGFLVTSTDDGILPIIAFSSDEDLIVDFRNPFWVMLNRDMPQRLAQARKLAGQPQAQSAVSSLDTHKMKWRELLSDRQISSLGLSSVSDLRVSPLVQSKWSQSTVNGNNTYNYYTPNYYVCGCVSTAGSQIMRYHQWPTASVSAGTYTCFVDEAATSKTMLGGTYSWTSMPLVPSYSTTLAQRQAIGKLTYDVGVASYMKYASNESGAYESNLAKAFMDRFGYDSARLILEVSGVDGYLQQAVLPNLDAGFPVAFHIKGSVGHEVVGDGYGYSSGDLYVHLNMGWAGSYDAWYNLPDVDSYYAYNLLVSIMYNIFPEHEGEIISGRVLNNLGNPVSGATIVAVNETLGTTLASVRSNIKGIYSVLVPKPSSPSTHSYHVTATSGSLIGAQSTTVSASVSTTTYYNESTGKLTYSSGSGSVGNRWGVDLTLAAAPTLSSITIIGPSSINENLSASYTCTANYSEGSSVDVTASTTWSENSIYASITSAGLLTVSSVPSDQAITVSASYSQGGVTKTDTHAVTIINIPVMTLPYSESFEFGMGVWLPSSGNDGDWRNNTGSTTSTGTGPDSASDGSYYVYMEASTGTGNVVGYPTKTAAMEAAFDFSGTTTPELTFDYHMYGAAMGALYVDVYDGTWHNGIWSRSGQQHASSSATWSNATVDLSAFAGGSQVKIRLRGITGTSWTSDIAVDKIRVQASKPSAPASVTASDGTSTASVTVSWTASSGATSYSVYRHTSSSSSSATLLGSTSNTVYTDSGANPGTLYYYWVKASNSSGASDFSPYNTGYRTLSAPTGVTASDDDSDKVAVSWSSVSGASYYRVYRATTSTGTKSALGSWQSSLNYSDIAAVADTTYYYWVVAAVSSSGVRPSSYSSYDTGTKVIASVSYSGGSGTVSDPYQIAIRADLLALSANTVDYDKHFIMTADIDLSGESFTTAVIAPAVAPSKWNYGFGMPFSGSFNGGGNLIKNLTINSPTGLWIGLFGQVTGVVKNLGIESCSVIGNGIVAGLCADNFSGLIENCYVAGVVQGVEYTGGLCGDNYEGTIKKCYADCTVSLSNSQGGGLCGRNYMGIIENCYSVGAVSGSSYVGGLCGYNDSGTFSSCFWDTQTSGMVISSGGTGKTTVAMQTQSTFTAAGWDFVAETVNGTDDIWYMDGYPALSCFNSGSAVTFDTWALNEDIPIGMRGDGDSPARDGIANLLKYACGLSAMQACNASDLMSVLDGDGSTFAVRYFKAKNATDVTLQPIWATSLTGAWSAFGIIDELVIDGAEREERKASIVIEDNDSGFIRLQAIRAP